MSLATFKSEHDDWQQFMQEEHSMEEYIQKFDIKLTREDIFGIAKQALMIEYIKDLAIIMNYKVIE
jgi:hypothetical protein